MPIYENIVFFALGIVFSIVFYLCIRGIDKLRFKDKRDPQYFLKKFQRASIMKKIELFFKRFNSIFITIVVLLVGIMAVDYITKNIKIQFNLIGYILVLIIILNIVYILYGVIKGAYKKNKGL